MLKACISFGSGRIPGLTLIQDRKWTMAFSSTPCCPQITTEDRPTVGNLPGEWVNLEHFRGADRGGIASPELVSACLHCINRLSGSVCLFEWRGTSHLISHW